MDKKPISKSYIVISIIIAIVSLILLVLFLLEDKSTEYEDYVEAPEVSSSLPDMTNTMSVEEIEQMWTDYENNRPEVSTIDSYEWSFIVEGFSYDAETQDVSMLVQNELEKRRGMFPIFTSIFEYKFKPEENSLQGDFYSNNFTTGVKENVYWFTVNNKLYVRVYNTPIE